jgi:hypothetical protein
MDHSSDITSSDVLFYCEKCGQYRVFKINDSIKQISKIFFSEYECKHIFKRL